MKTVLFIVLGIILFNTISSAQQSLSGTITAADSKQPLAGVSIYFPDLQKGAITNNEGKYSIANIPNGSFLIEFTAVGYQTVIDQITLPSRSAKNVTLYPATANLKEVMVTGLSSAIDRQKNPVATTSISSASLFASTSTNIIDAISNTPGLSQITDGPAISKPVIRGLGYNRVVVINDGVRQEGQQWGDEFGIEIDENTVNKVEVLKGPASLSYGSDAMAGVINFLSPTPLPEGSNQGSVLANYQTNNGLYNFTGNWAGNQKGFSWDVRYTIKQAHNYQNKYDGFVWNSGFGEQNAKAIVGINRKWGYSHVHLSLFDLKLGITEGARDSATGQFDQHYPDADGSDSLGLAPASAYSAYNNYAIVHQHVQHYKAVWDNQLILGSGKLGVKLGFQTNFRREANDITRGDIYNNYFFLRTFNYDIQYSNKTNNNWEWSSGVNGMLQSSQDRGLVYLVPEYRSFDIGAFATARKTIGAFTISGGLRFDARTLHTDNLYTDFAGNRIKNPDAASVLRFTAYQSDFTGVSGSVGVAYDFSKTVYAKLNIARGFRAPNIAESGSNGIHDGTPFYEIGDPNLTPESSLQVDATFGINQTDFSLELTPFVNKINHYIFPVKLASVFGGDSIRNDIALATEGPTFKYVSGDAVLSGGEIVLNVHPLAAKWLRWESAFSTVQAIQQNQGDSTKYLPYTPPDKFQTGVNILLGNKKGWLQHSALSAALQYYFEQNKIYYKFGDETITPAYGLVNLGVSTDIYGTKEKLCTLQVTATNLFDVAYQSNMSRLKYSDPNNVTGRIGVFNMGRNISFKLLVPLNFK